MSATTKRRCYVCLQFKFLEEFRLQKGKPFGRGYICLECLSRTGRERSKENTQFLYEYLMEHPCVDCGETDPIVLTFDHQYGKKENVSDMAGRYIWESILEEIKKCEVRCANCHARKTAKDRNTYMYRIVSEVK